MGTYPVWRKAADKHDLKRLTFVCGSETILVEEVIDETKAQLEAVDYYSFNLDIDDPSLFFNALYQYSLTESPRLLLVRGTDRLDDWEPFYEWLEDSYLSMPKTHVLLVSSASHLHVREDVQWKKDPAGHKILRKPAESLGARGRLVECKPMSTDELVKWAQRWAPSLSIQTSRYLVARLGEDHAKIKHAAKKLNLFQDYYIDQATVDQLATENVGSTFVEFLLRGKKYHAVQAAENISVQDYPRVFSQLDHMLDVLSILNSELRRFITKREQQQIPGVSPWHAETYGKLSFAYDEHKVRRCRNALAYLEDAYHTDGITYLDEEDGILEALVTLWV